MWGHRRCWFHSMPSGRLLVHSGCLWCHTSQTGSSTACCRTLRSLQHHTDHLVQQASAAPCVHGLQQASKQAASQADRQASRQVGRQACRQAGGRQTANEWLVHTIRRGKAVCCPLLTFGFMGQTSKHQPDSHDQNERGPCRCILNSSDAKHMENSGQVIAASRTSCRSHPGFSWLTDNQTHYADDRKLRVTCNG